MRYRASLIVALAALWLNGQPADAPNRIANGAFDRDIAGWSPWFRPGQADGEATWRPRGEGGAMHVDVRTCERESAVQIYYGPFPVEAGVWYSIEFEGRAAEETQLRLTFMRNNPPYTSLGLRTSPTFGPTWRRYGFLVQATHTVDDARIDFFLPVGSFDLDDVAVRALSGEPPTAPVQSAQLGRGVSGQAAHFIDGDEKTRIWLGGYPVMPAFVTLDLGKETPISRVVVPSLDRSRHLALGRMECEVSRDGTDWRCWATFEKTAGKKTGDSQETTFSASGGAVAVRYVRLRVTQVKNTAPLYDVRVFAAPAADPQAVGLLPKVIPSSLLAFQGWDYAAKGYDLSSGEVLALRFANQGNVPVEVGLAWTLETYAGDAVDHGVAKVSAAPGELADAPLALTRELADGHYRVRFSFADAFDSEAFHFDCRRAAGTAAIPRLSIGAYLDTQDPEGWVWLSAGPLRAHLDVRRRLGTGPAPDALLVSSEAWKADDARVQEVHDYVRQGGLALVYGNIAPAFDDLLPVQIDRDAPRQPQSVTLDGAALGLTGSPLPQRAMQVLAKPRATVLAAWSSGLPAVVEGSFGKGRVIYVGAGLGRAWTELELGQAPADRLVFPLLYGKIHGSKAADAVRALLAERSGNWCAQRPDTLSVGRFGWQIGEGGLVENLSGTARLSGPMSRDIWGPRVPGREIVRGVPDSMNWLSKRVRWVDEAGANVLASTVSMGAPCVLWEGQGNALEIDCGSANFLCEADGTMAEVSAGESIAGARLSAGWVILPNADPSSQATPRYVQFARRPTRIALLDGVLRAEFPADSGVFWTGRLFGIRRFAADDSSWRELADRQASRLASLCLAFPVAAKETGAQVPDEAFWRVENEFEYRVVSDEFGTKPLTMAPIPPVFALVHAHAPQLARIANGTAEDLGVATKYGPLMGVAGSRLVYEVSQVADEHFGVVPLKGDTTVQQLADFHGKLAVDVGKQAPSGLVSGGSSYLADLREYMSCGQFKPPVSAPCIDLYKWWYCFPSVAGRPVYSPEARQVIDAHYLSAFRDTLDLYPHKTIVRYRREPWTGKDYSVSFIWPVSWQDGVRYFVDQNESSAVIAYCLWTYAQYYGDWDTVRANWHLARWLWAYVPRVQDWALMCSSNQEYFSTAGIDMLNSEYPGNLAFARMAHVVGDADAERLARHLAAKSSIPAVARFLLPAYTESITAPDDPWRKYLYYWSMHEGNFSGSESVIMRGSTWSVLQLGIGMYDTSKGTGPEIALLFKNFVPEQVEAYERDLLAAEKQYNDYAGWAHLMSRGFLGWPKEELVSTAQRTYEAKGGLGWQSTKYPHNLGAMATAGSGFHLLDWTPAAYVSGELDLATNAVSLNFVAQGGTPVVVRAHSRHAVTDVAVAGAKLLESRDDPATGTWTARIEASGAFQLQLRLAGPSRPTACTYFPTGSGRPQ